MPASPDAVIEDRQGQTALRFERVLAHPPERVWRALTEPAAMAHWHPSPAEFEQRPGGIVRYLAKDDKPTFPDGEVIEYDPPNLLEHSWGEDRLRWELEPRADGTLLVLTHVFDDHFKAARDAAGWHLCLDALVSELDDRPVAAPVGELPPGWRELNRSYEQRFGIAPEQATPPPGQ